MTEQEEAYQEAYQEYVHRNTCGGKGKLGVHFSKNKSWLGFNSSDTVITLEQDEHLPCCDAYLNHPARIVQHLKSIRHVFEKYSLDDYVDFRRYVINRRIRESVIKRELGGHGPINRYSRI